MAETTAPAKPPSRTKWMLLAGGIILLLLVAAGAAFFVWQRSATAAASPAEVKPAPSGIVPLESFLVNLADTDSRRFGRVTVRLVVDTAEVAEETVKDPVRQARLRSAVLELLTLQTASRLVTTEGKTELKNAIAERASRVLEHKVHDVLFTDFVVQ